MTRYSSTMTEALQEIREGFSSKQIKMAIGIASDKRYAGGNMTGAVNAIEKIKKGLSDHPQVAAVLKRQNEDIEEELDELKDAISKKDLKETIDALTDILYVTYGAGHAFGVNLDKCFEEVQNSNMSKLGSDGKPIYNDKGKVMKGPNYFKPNLGKFVA